MKLVLEAMSDANEASELEVVLLSLKRLGFLLSCQQLADGSYLADVPDELLKELSQMDSWGGHFSRIKVSPLQ